MHAKCIYTHLYMYVMLLYYAGIYSHMYTPETQYAYQVCVRARIVSRVGNVHDNPCAVLDLTQRK